MVVVVVVGREEGFELLRRRASNLTMLVLILEYYQLNEITARRGAPLSRNHQLSISQQKFFPTKEN